MFAGVALLMVSMASPPALPSRHAIGNALRAEDYERANETVDCSGPCDLWKAVGKRRVRNAECLSTGAGRARCSFEYECTSLEGRDVWCPRTSEFEFEDNSIFGRNFWSVVPTATQ
jgi:hypothetical protein